MMHTEESIIEEMTSTWPEYFTTESSAALYLDSKQEVLLMMWGSDISDSDAADLIERFVLHADRYDILFFVLRRICEGLASDTYGADAIDQMHRCLMASGNYDNDFKKSVSFMMNRFCNDPTNPFTLED